jgi:aspartyl-tRNA(Asn)/glutamyl-tRNA(Gln) amidotransferase subunit C
MSAPSSPDFDLDRLAELARLALTPEEKARFAAQVGDVISYISLLKEADVTGIEPTAHAYPIFNVLAEDVARPGLPVEAALRNAPEQRDNMIVVPKVVE